MVRPKTGVSETRDHQVGVLRLWQVQKGSKVKLRGSLGSWEQVSQSLGDMMVSLRPARHHCGYSGQVSSSAEGRGHTQAPEKQCEATDCRAKPCFLAICPLLGVGGLKARAHYWLVQRGGLQPQSLGMLTGPVFKKL